MLKTNIPQNHLDNIIKMLHNMPELKDDTFLKLRLKLKDKVSQDLTKQINKTLQLHPKYKNYEVHSLELNSGKLFPETLEVCWDPQLGVIDC